MLNIKQITQSVFDKVTFCFVVYFFLGFSLLTGAVSTLFIHYHFSSVLYFITWHYIMAIGTNISYHRYFSHHSFKVNRFMQFILGLWGSLGTQRGPLWWSSNHRLHHRFCETENDPHSPNKGFYYSHFGWTIDPKYMKVQKEYIKDFLHYKELWFLEYAYILMLFIVSYISYKIGGLAFMLSYHMAISTSVNAEAFVNSLCHQRGVKTCKALDNYWIAFLTGGDGFHRYHHINPACAKHSEKWYQFDLTYYILVLLQQLHLISALNMPHKKKIKQIE